MTETVTVTETPPCEKTETFYAKANWEGDTFVWEASGLGNQGSCFHDSRTLGDNGTPDIRPLCDGTPVDGGDCFDWEILTRAGGEPDGQPMTILLTLNTERCPDCEILHANSKHGDGCVESSGQNTSTTWFLGQAEGSAMSHFEICFACCPEVGE